jgi:hypothetical protein
VRRDSSSTGAPTTSRHEAEAAEPATVFRIHHQEFPVTEQALVVLWSSRRLYGLPTGALLLSDPQVDIGEPSSGPSQVSPQL